MNRTQTRLAVLAAALTIPTGFAVGSIAFAQNAHHVATVAQATAPHAQTDAETNDGPDTDNIQEGPGNWDKADTPDKGEKADKETADGPQTADVKEAGDMPDAPASR